MRAEKTDDPLNNNWLIYDGPIENETFLGNIHVPRSVTDEAAVLALWAQAQIDINNPSAWDQRRTDMLQRAEVADVVQKLNSATPTEIETWVNNNMTTLAQGRVIIATILKVLAAKL